MCLECIQLSGTISRNYSFEAVNAMKCKKTMVASSDSADFILLYLSPLHAAELVVDLAVFSRNTQASQDTAL
jgi:hypothetical protein